MASFKNPNDPPQPQPGVYGWFVETERGARCLYIGAAGKVNTPKLKGTLLRGVTELQRDTFSADSPGYRRLDTDFVVGTTIQFFESKGMKVYWEHISNDPQMEDQLHRQLQPFIQKEHTPQIVPELKIEMPERHYWKWPGSRQPERCRQKTAEAEARIFEKLEARLTSLPL